MKSIKISILILSAIVIFISVALFFVSKNTNNNIINEANTNINILEEDLEEDLEEGDLEENIQANENIEIQEAIIHQHTSEELLNLPNEFQLVKDRNAYYTVKNILNTFFTNVGYLDATLDELGIIPTNNMNVEETFNEYKNIGIIALKNMLSKSYLNDFNITDDKLYLTFKGKDKEVNIDHMYVIENKSAYMKTYLIYFTGKETKKSSKIIIQTYLYNNTFLIYPEDYIEQNGYDINIKEIEKNDYNKFRKVNISGETMCKYYLEDYQYRLNNNAEEVYALLDDNYSKKRFSDIKDFKEYASQIISKVKTATLSKYRITDYKDYSEYDCVDQNGMHYIFRETAVMEYTLLLDEYTIVTEEEIKYYNSLSQYEKAKYNLEKFKRMLETKDYNAIYNILETTFKSNNFKTKDELKKYLQKNTYEISSIKLDDVRTENDYYVFDCEVENMKNDKEYKDMTVIMKINEGTNFEMSFSIKE